MSQIPRRTTENQQGSARNSSSLRPSRVNSVSKPSSYQSRMSHLPSGNNRASVRNSPTTPHRTPMKTPTKPMTAEKQKPPYDDKEAMNTMHMRILEVLAEIGGYNDIVQKGLRVITVKQFLSILKHFLLPIIGTLPDDFEPNYLERVIPIMQQLEYPYSIQKSFLKTPSHPPNQNALILLLSFVIDFLKFDQPIEYVTGEGFSNPEMTRDVVEKLVEFYGTYKDGIVEREEAQQCVVNYYRHLLTGVDPNLTLDINRIEDEIQEISDGIKPSTLAKELQVKMTELNSLESKIRKHQENIVELSRKKENANAELGMSRSAKRSAHDEVQRLNAQLSRQKFNTDMRHALLVEITQTKSALTSKRNAVIELREASSVNEILLSNLISKKFQLIDRLNNMVCKISSDMKIAGIGEKFDSDEFLIISTKGDVDLDQHLEHVSRGLKQLKEIYLNALSAFKEEILQLENEYQMLKISDDMRALKLTQAKASLQQLLIEEKNLELEYKSFLQNIQNEYVSHKERLETVEREIDERTKGIEQLKLDVEESKEKKSQFGSKAISECERLYDERKEEMDSHRKTLDENHAIIDNYKKNKSPLSERLQKTLNGILSKRADKENGGNSSQES